MTPFARFKIIFMLLLLIGLISFARSSHSFPAAPASEQQLVKGVFLVQSEGEKPELCQTVDGVMDIIKRIDPKAVIDHHSHPSKRTNYVAYLSDGSGMVIPIDDSGLVCSAVAVPPLKALIIREMANDKSNDIKVVPVWPKKED